MDDPFGLHLPEFAAPPRSVQTKAASARGGANSEIQATAAQGVAGPGGTLPHLDQIQEAFGHHDVRGVRAHVGGNAERAATAIGATAYATGNAVALPAGVDLHTTAHEAAHIVQQREGVQLYGGVGVAGDVYEQHADAVADLVVRGQSAAALLDAGPRGGVAATAAVQRKGSGGGKRKDSEPTLPVGTKLLRSAATDLRALAVRLAPVNAAIPMLGIAVSPAEAVATIAAAARRADEASGAGRENSSDEIENLATAVRDLAMALPPDLRKEPAVTGALDALQTAIGELATAAGTQLPAEPIVVKPELDEAHQAELVRTLLSDASVALDVDASGGLAKERKVYARAATIATDKLRIAVDLINAHVPRGSGRVALGQRVAWVSERIDKLDQWTRVSGADPDAAIAALYANEQTLRELTGLAPAPRAAVASMDADAVTDRIVAGAEPPRGPATIEDVRIELTAVLTSLHDAISNFAEAADEGPPAPKDQGLAEKLVGAAVGGVFGGSIPGAFARAAVDAMGGGSITEKAFSTIVDHGVAVLGEKPATNAVMLLHQYTRTLRSRFLATQTAMLTSFNHEPRLKTAHPDALRALADRLRDHRVQITNDVTAGYVLGWQTLLARAVGGVPNAPTTIGDAIKPGPGSTYDANVTPAVDMKIPGVLKVHLPIQRANPRGSSVDPATTEIEGITSDHLKMLRAMSARPLRDLHLNTVIQVSYEGGPMERAEIVWHPDSGDVDVAWFRGATYTRDLHDARHLQAYALGVPTTSHAVDAATAEDALRGAQMIAAAVTAAPVANVIRKRAGGSSS
ncbi:MAG: DUF4157 domain-containing protein [Myxococcales bacterium]|nr:DUF4157 domain-containing protein [Myxococcales bacterium]MBK7192687.1 DUF4157 domain-containing protein [Myxococcales bacterium]MBP6846951.1 DUF4157 domain-containing protein [Kofleriaceae bacterium]